MFGENSLVRCKYMSNHLYNSLYMYLWPMSLQVKWWNKVFDIVLHTDESYLIHWKIWKKLVNSSASLKKVAMTHFCVCLLSLFLLSFLILHSCLDENQVRTNMIKFTRKNVKRCLLSKRFYGTSYNQLTFFRMLTPIAKSQRLKCS